MSQELVQSCVVPGMSEQAIARSRQMEEVNWVQPQLPIETQHLFHAGLYARTVHLSTGTLITGALIKRATLLIISGDVLVYVGEASVRLVGYRTLAASANRKQVFFALAPTDMTMLFATEAKTVEEAEAEFTDEVELLLTRREPGLNHVLITGE